MPMLTKKPPMSLSLLGLCICVCLAICQAAGSSPSLRGASHTQRSWHSLHSGLGGLPLTKEEDPPSCSTLPYKPGFSMFPSVTQSWRMVSLCKCVSSPHQGPTHLPKVSDIKEVERVKQLTVP